MKKTSVCPSVTIMSSNGHKTKQAVSHVKALSQHLHDYILSADMSIPTCPHKIANKTSLAFFF